MPKAANNHIYKSVVVIDDTDIDRLLAEKIVRKYDFADEVILMESAEEIAKPSDCPN
jgi:hypothetical protein